MSEDSKKLTGRELDGALQMELDPTSSATPPRYSTDPAASKALRDKMRELGWNYRILSPDHERKMFEANFWMTGTMLHIHTSHAATEERCVSEAAILAVRQGGQQ